MTRKFITVKHKRTFTFTPRVTVNGTTKIKFIGAK